MARQTASEERERERERKKENVNKILHNVWLEIVGRERMWRGADEHGRHGRPLEHVVKCVRVLLLLLLLVLLVPMLLLSGNNKRSNCGNNSEQDTLCVV